MEDMLVWVALLLLAWIAESIASARRKKRQPPTDRTRQRAPQPARPPARPAGPPRGLRPEPTSRRPEPSVRVPPEVVIVRRPPAQQVPVPEGLWAEGVARVPSPHEAVTLEREADVASLETLEPAGGASHVAFHEKYLDQPPPPQRVRRRIHLGRGDVRRGIILAEILGRPKSER